MFSAGFVVEYYQQVGDWALAELKLPRVFRILEGAGLPWVSIGDLFTQRMNYPLDLQRRLASALTGGVAGILLLIITWVFHRYFIEQRTTWTITALSVFLFIGATLPPVLEFGSPLSPCSTNFLGFFEQAGRSLSETIPSDSLVSWKGSGRHIALMLYVDDIQIFAPQINAGGGLMVSGKRDHLLKFGVFDGEIAAEWDRLADVLIVWKRYPNTQLSDFENNPDYEKIPYVIGKLDACEAPLYLFRRRP
jgi:hypothetical protein